jgi:hypothetical protein
MLASDLALALDAVLLFERAVGTPDPWQEGVLRSTADRLLLNCCRQSGKSTLVAALSVHHALFVPGSLTLMLSPSQRQSQELLKKAVGIYRAVGRPVAAEAETLLRLELENGSRILSLPGRDATVRGYSNVGLLLVDEASRVDDALIAAVRPMLAVSNGRLIALSTPWGARGWWWKAWEEGADDWQRVRIPASECPRISPEFLEEERRALGELAFRSEYLCEFCDTDDSAFRTEHLLAATTDEFLPWEED